MKLSPGGGKLPPGSKLRRSPSLKRSPSMMAAYQLESLRPAPRWRSLSVNLAIFAAGALLMLAFLNYGAMPERSAPSKLSVLSANGPSGAVMSRRGLYTSSSSSGGMGAPQWSLLSGWRQPSQQQQQQQAVVLPSAISGSGRTQQQQPQSQQQQQSPGAAARLGSGPGRPGGGGAGAGGRASSSSSSARVPPRAPGSIDTPRDFDWRGYLMRYADLRAAGVRTRDAAVTHYTSNGHKEGRKYARPRVMLRYTACQGLFNQMYAHLNALVLAEYLGADVVLPPSVYRESFAKYFTMDDMKKNEVKWTPTDTGALLDVDALQKHYAAKGITVHRTPPYASFPDCMHPQDAFPRYDMPGVKAEQVVQLPDTYLQSMHIWYLWDRAADKVMAKQRELHDRGFPDNTTVVLDLPCPFLSIMTLTCMDAAQGAATALRFNRTIVAMARTVIAGMRAAGVPRYNGAHLRLERDAVDWARILGGLPKYLAEYAKSFAAAGFSPRKDLYIASGLLSYDASEEMASMLKFLRPHSKSVQYKELYLPPQALRGLNPEQEALVDFLVLSNADNFVGLGSSTFSVYLREYRVLLGRPRLADVFVDTSKIGTDALFERCTHFAPLDTTAAARGRRPALAQL